MSVRSPDSVAASSSLPASLAGPGLALRLPSLCGPQLPVAAAPEPPAIISRLAPGKEVPD